jgi:hypothetical protein
MHAAIPAEGRVTVEKERIGIPRKRANALVICNMIQLQIRLRAIQARLEASPKRKVPKGLEGARGRN